jgi:hypothetical protein
VRSHEGVQAGRRARDVRVREPSTSHPGDFHAEAEGIDRDRREEDETSRQQVLLKV